MHQGNETHSPEMSRIPVPPKKRKRSLLSRKRCSVSQVSPRRGFNPHQMVTRLCLGFWSWKSPAPPFWCLKNLGSGWSLCTAKFWKFFSWNPLQLGSSIRRSSSQVHNIDKNHILWFWNFNERDFLRCNSHLGRIASRNEPFPDPSK